MKAWIDKVRKFFAEVREEFWKCTRPSKEELKESTVVVVATMLVLGLFITCADMVITFVVRRVLG